MRKTDRDPSHYLASLPDEVRDSMQRLDRLIADIMRGESRVLWEGVFWGGTEQTIIGYGDLRSDRARGKVVEWFMVGLALQKNYISIYVNAVEDRQYVGEKYRSKLGKVKVGKASISFRSIEDLDLDALRKLLEIARRQISSPPQPPH